MTTKRKSQYKKEKYIAVGVKGTEIGDDFKKYARPLVNILQKELYDSGKIETEEVAQMGTGSLQHNKYRKPAVGGPSFTDKLRFCEGFEELLYGLSGNYKKEDYIKYGATIPKVFKYIFDFHVSNADELPFFTIWQGSWYGEKDNVGGKIDTIFPGDALCWNNAMLNTFELSTIQDDLPTINVEFVSDYVNHNFPSSARLLPKDLRMGENVTWYRSSVDATDEEMLNNPLTCLTESNFSINNNIEPIICTGNDFRKTAKLPHKREIGGSLVLDDTFYNHNHNEHFVTKDMPHEQLWCKIESVGRIHGTDVPYSVLYKFLDVNIDEYYDNDSIRINFSVNKNGLKSFMIIEVVTDLYALRIDDECILFEEILE